MDTLHKGDNDDDDDDDNDNNNNNTQNIPRKTLQISGCFSCLILIERHRNMRRNFHGSLVTTHTIWHAVCLQPSRQAGCRSVLSCT
jgi:hypothetical protein